MVASLVLTAGITSAITYSVVAPTATFSLEDQLMSGHRRALLAESPIDVASSDRHTVRPWFDRKLGVSPPTPDLSRFGFPLVGGRVDVINGRAVPSLVYRRNGHMITVVAMAAGADVAEAPESRAAGGYNIVRWSGSGFRYWAISDLDAAELGSFVDKMRAG